MFKNASIFKITQPNPILIATVDKAMVDKEFVPCGSSQERSVGWVPPRGSEHDAMVENIGGHLIMRLMVETKSVPASAVRDAVDAKCKQLLATTGRKPGKKEKREIADDARLALLPMAFPVRSSTLIWIDPTAGLLVVDSASQARLDEVTMQLVNLVDGVTIQYMNTQASPQACMAMWLTDVDAPRGMFDIGRECLLRACDESKAVVKYGRHALDIEEVAQHIRMGKMPTKLAMTFNDRVSFVLTDAMTLKKVDILDVVIEQGTNLGEDSGFDCDVAIVTGELSKLIPELIAALGGEVEVA